MKHTVLPLLACVGVLIALGPTAAAHGGEYTANGVTEATNPFAFTLAREPDADPNATVPAGMFPTIFTVTLKDATGAVVEQETFAGFDNFDGHGTTAPWTYMFSVRNELQSGVHFHGAGDAVRANLFVLSGHFEGSAEVHHGFNAVAVAG